MNKAELLAIFDSHHCCPNIENLVGLCASEIRAETNELQIIDGRERPFPSDHFCRIYRGRLRNPNGIAAKIPGLVASTENFCQFNGPLAGISIRSKDLHIVFWLDDSGALIGCMKFFAE
jgi:hypothetical protein